MELEGCVGEGASKVQQLAFIAGCVLGLGLRLCFAHQYCTASWPRPYLDCAAFVCSADMEMLKCFGTNEDTIKQERRPCFSFVQRSIRISQTGCSNGKDETSLSHSPPFRNSSPGFSPPPARLTATSRSPPRPLPPLLLPFQIHSFLHPI